MKPIVFYGTINLESDILYVQSNEDYYSVDVERVVRLYARLMNHSIEEVPYEE